MKRQAGSPPIAWAWVALSLVILFVVVVRVRLLALPLERDEGEYAYVGQLMLQGVAPYTSAYVVKLPGTAAVYALSMALFGQTPVGIRMGLLFASVAAIILIFLLAKRWFGDGVALIAGATYALMSLSWGVMGNAAHATQFIVPVAVGGLLLMLRGLKTGRLPAFFWSGLLFGLAFVLKQPGLLFGVYGGFLILYNDLTSRPIPWMACVKKAAAFCLGIILPFAALCLLVARADVFDRFWFWSFTVAGGGWVSMQQGWTDFVWYANWVNASGQTPFWLLAGAILPFVFWMRAVRPVRISFLAFCAVSLLAGAAGLRFNPHYLVLTLPAAGMVIGLGVVEGRRLLRESQSLASVSIFPVVLFCLACGSALFVGRDYYFSGDLDQIMQTIYGANPFREAARVAEYIKKNSAPDSRIAVLGSEPEICFLARRHSATGHLSTYILMDRRPYSHQMQEEMLREITAVNPEFIVYVDNIRSWYPPADADNTLLDAMMQRLKEHYRRVGAAVTPPGSGQPAYYWDADAMRLPASAKPHTSYLLVYRLNKSR